MIQVLKQKFQLEVQIAEELILRPKQITPQHDLYILKSHSEWWLSIAGILHHQGAHFINPYPACAILQDKIITLRYLGISGVPTPRTWINGSRELLFEIVADIPLILKPYDGKRCKGVVLVSIVEELAELPPQKQVIVAQEYIENANQELLKVYIIGDQVFALRKPSWPNQLSGNGHPCPVSREICAIALRCGQAFDLRLYGIDVIEGSQGPMVIDMNYFPSYRGIPEAGQHLADYVTWYANNDESALPEVDLKSVELVNTNHGG